MVHPGKKKNPNLRISYYACARGVHHSALWCWNYVGGKSTCEPVRVFLQILPKYCHIWPHFEGKEKDPPYLASLFPELMSL